MTAYGKKIVQISVAVLLIGSAYIAGIYTGYANRSLAEKVVGVSNQSVGQPDAVDFAPFWQAWRVIDERFVATHQGLGSTTDATSTAKIATNQDRVYGAIQGMFAALGDPYTVFFPPEEARAFQDEVSGTFGGVGMEIGIRDGALIVVAPLKDTPAFRAGIKSGDKILTINGVNAAGLPVDSAVRQIRGPKGSKVQLGIQRGNDPEKEFTITRDTIIIPTISTEGSSPLSNEKAREGIRPDGVFVIHLYNFSAQSPELFRQALQKFIDSGSTKLMLDLRGNPGGYLDAAVSMASWFLPKDALVVSERTGTGANVVITEHKSLGYAVQLPRIPRIAILIDRGSASASEILAGALQEHKIAKIIGERSFGKGSVQELVPITPGTEAKITIARWFTPLGHSISDSGLTPDFMVTISATNTAQKIDPQFDKAIDVLQNNSLWK